MFKITPFDHDVKVTNLIDDLIDERTRRTSVMVYTRKTRLFNLPGADIITLTNHLDIAPDTRGWKKVVQFLNLNIGKIFIMIHFHFLYVKSQFHCALSLSSFLYKYFSTSF